MMIWAILAALLVIGLVLRLPGRVMILMVALLWGAVFLAHLILPQDHSLAQALGGDWRSWGALGLGGAGVLAYRAGLNRLRKHAAPSVVQASGAFSDSELERYARHIVLREIGGTGQKKLKAARVLVVGAGGLGSPALLYLAAAGVGTIGVIDDDDVSNSNLQRQIIHTDARIGQPKVASAKASMLALNPFISVQTYHERLDPARAQALFGGYDLILDGSDNFDTRYLVNEAAVAAQKPLVSAAITQWEGQIGVFDPARGGPCYACVFPQRPEASLAPSCAEAGVIAPLPGVMGAMMALEAVKYLTGAGATLTGSLLIYDGLWGESRKLKAARRADCKLCGADAALLDSSIAGA
ncbi:MAG: HesA/MoeB/ThiF family protein [Albidovulum sp.]